MNLDQLQAKIEEYLLTKDDIHKDEGYTTARKFAAYELSDFMNWLSRNNNTAWTRWIGYGLQNLITRFDSETQFH